MRWSSWLLTILGIVFMIVGVWAWNSTPNTPNNGALVAPMFIGGSILLAAGAALMSCGWGCGSYCGYDSGGCGCGHCDGCKGGECCGHCGCEGQVAHEHGEHGHEGHSH